MGDAFLPQYDSQDVNLIRHLIERDVQQRRNDGATNADVDPAYLLGVVASALAASEDERVRVYVEELLDLRAEWLDHNKAFRDAYESRLTGRGPA